MRKKSFPYFEEVSVMASLFLSQYTRFWVPLFHNGHIIGRVVVKQ